jgi:soluble lytic murein transglycosylase-like protein
MRLLVTRTNTGLLLAIVGALAVVAGCGGSSAPSIPGVSVPVGYRSYFVVAARRCPGILTPAGLAAQAYVESSFQPNAVSPAGAQGLMQITPDNWRIYGTDAIGDGRADPFTPADSIAAAAKFDCVLARAVRNIPGDPTSLWLASYNAGINAVRHANGVPPFTETQQYVQQVKQWTVTFGPDFAPGGP